MPKIALSYEYLTGVGVIIPFFNRETIMGLPISQGNIRNVMVRVSTQYPQLRVLKTVSSYYIIQLFIKRIQYE